MKVIRISKDTNMTEISLQKCTTKNLLSNLKNNSISEGNNDIKLLFTWRYNDSIITCYGWYDGKCWLPHGNGR